MAAVPEEDAIEADVPAEDYSHLFRMEGLVLDVDLRVDVAENFSRYVAGNEDIELDSDTVLAGESMTITRGARTRRAGAYQRHTHEEEILAIPGVGKRMAHEFEEYRPYSSMEQFRREIGKYVDDGEVARLERYVEIR